MHPRAVAGGAPQDAEPVGHDERAGQRLLQAEKGQHHQSLRERRADRGETEVRQRAEHQPAPPEAVSQAAADRL